MFSNDSGINFLNGKPFSDEYYALYEKWAGLPMLKDSSTVESFVDSYHKNNVTIVISGTGSGKTVIVPKIVAKLLSDSYSKDEKEKKKFKIAITNPKSSSTLANADYAARCMDVRLGFEVGYSFRGAPNSSKGKSTSLLYMTDGLLLAQMRNDYNLNDYSTVIIDEAHERPPPVDFLIQLSIDTMKARPEFKLVVMSATIDEAVFRKYFEKNGLKVGVVNAKGTQGFQVDHKYAEKSSGPEFMPFGIEAVKSISKDKTNKTSDILFFVPTSADAVKGCKLFRDIEEEDCASCSSVLCTELYSKASEDSKTASLVPPPDGFTNKVIFATNVAESSFTFPGLGYVIDSGYELSSTWNPIIRAQVIDKRITTQAQMTQREGRVGRQGPGTVIHLYSEADRKKQKPYPDPRIVEMDLTQEILSMLAHGDIEYVIKSCQALLTPPRVHQVAGALALLHYYDCIDCDVTTINYDTVKKLEDMEKVIGTITGVGSLVYGAMTGSKLGPFTAILFVIGALLDQGERSFLLACILEEVSSDPGSMFPIVSTNKSSNDYSNNLPQSSNDYDTLLKVYDIANDPLIDSGKFFEATGMSHNFWKKIIARTSDNRNVAGKNVVITNLPSVTHKFRAKFDEMADKYPDAMQRVVLIARMYHHVKTVDKVSVTVNFDKTNVDKKVAFKPLVTSQVPSQSTLDQKDRVVEQFSMFNGKLSAYITCAF